jgi:hypothetical protein
MYKHTCCPAQLVVLHNTTKHDGVAQGGPRGQILCSLYNLFTPSDLHATSCQTTGAAPLSAPWTDTAFDPPTAVDR